MLDESFDEEKLPNSFENRSKRFYAFHEAGHFVVGHSFGWTPLLASIVVEGDKSGRVDWDMANAIPNPTESGIVAVSGVVATAIDKGATCCSEVRWPFPGMTSDDTQCYHAMFVYYATNADKSITWPISLGEYQRIVKRYQDDKIFAKYVEDEEGAWNMRCVCGSFKIVKDNWLYIERIAAALELRSSLTESELLAFFD